MISAETACWDIERKLPYFFTEDLLPVLPSSMVWPKGGTGWGREGGWGKETGCNPWPPILSAVGDFSLCHDRWSVFGATQAWRGGGGGGDRGDTEVISPLSPCHKEMSNTRTLFA
jgi:hypothetical protein